MEELSITWQTILAFCGGVAVIAGAVKIIWSTFSPLRELKKRVDKHDTILDKDNNRLKSIEDGQKVQCQALMCIMQHMIDGNDINNLKKVRNEINTYLINK